jgi:putative flippase GtrA
MNSMYMIFAVISTLLNLIFQYLTLLIYNGYLSLYIAMFVGTFVGLISKYILDKKFIFQFKPKNRMNDAKTFISYTLTGGVTTLFFWVIEISFDNIFGGEVAKYIGAIIGLSLGYSIKYFLDKKFVFNQNIDL